MKKKEMGVEPAGACLLRAARRALAAGERAARGELGDCCRAVSGREERGDCRHNSCRFCDSPATEMRRLLCSEASSSRSIPGCWVAFVLVTGGGFFGNPISYVCKHHSEL